MRLRAALAISLLAACGPGEETENEPAKFNVRMTNVSPPGWIEPTGGEPTDVTFAPGVVVFHDSSFTMFQDHEPIPYASFEALVEDGNNAPLIAELSSLEGVFLAESFAALDENYNSAPMHPDDQALLSLEAEPGTRITVVAMYGESNDVFVATPPSGVALFDAKGAPAYGDISSELAIWDAGTEVNEEPGAGPNQPARQAAPNTGTDENGTVEDIHGVDGQGFAYPNADEAVQLELYGEGGG